MTSLIKQIQNQHHTLQLPDNHIVLEGEHTRLTLGNLVEQSHAMATFLQGLKIKTLALYASNSPEWLIVDFACQQAGICLLPLPAFFSRQQLQHCLKESAADALLSDNNLLMASLGYTDAPVDENISGFSLYRLTGNAATNIPQGTSKITFTSGSTGSPKGVCLDSHLQQIVATSLADAVGLQQHRHLCLLPLSTLLENVGGAYRALLAGGTVQLLPEQQLGFSGTGVNIKRLLASLESSQPDTLIVLPELLQALNLSCMQGWQPPSSLKYIAVGGARVAAKSIERARRFGLPVFEGYGLSECGSVVCLNTATADQAGSCGKTLPHNTVTLDNGEIIVSGKVFLGYLNEPDSWYPQACATGDLASIDEQGFTHIKGRRKNLLISSYGRNINPEWIESLILVNTGIQQCVVLGDAQPFCIAIIATRDHNISHADLQQWLDHCNNDLPEYARIKAFIHLPNAMTAAEGLYTDNGRPKRQAILTHFAAAIDALYRKHPDFLTLSTEVA